MRRQCGDAGSATAEFAVVVPAVVLLIALVAGTLSATGRQVRLEHAAAQAARLIARGESDGGAEHVLAAIAGATLSDISVDGDLVCVEVTAPAGLAVPVPALRARSCALDGGR